MVIDKNLIDELLKDVLSSDRLRWNYDLQTSITDTSQRMLNALQPTSQVSIHRNEATAETVICVYGKPEKIFTNLSIQKEQRWNIKKHLGNYFALQNANMEYKSQQIFGIIFR